MNIAIPMLLGLFGSQIAGLKLSPAEITAKLKDIPVFVLADAGGRPVVENVNDRRRISVFFGREELEEFRTKNLASLPSGVRASVVPLANLFGRGIELSLVPIRAEVGKAEAVLDAENKLANLPPRTRKYEGIPLFYLATNASYVTLNQPAGPIIPMLFSHFDAETLASRIVQAQPQQPRPIIKVTSLTSFLGVLEKDPASTTRMLVLIVHPKALRDSKELSAIKASSESGPGTQGAGIPQTQSGKQGGGRVN